VTVAVIILALIPLIGLQLFLAVPLIGLALTAGTPPDYVTDAKPVDRRPRNIVLGVVILRLPCGPDRISRWSACLAVGRGHTAQACARHFEPLDARWHAICRCAAGDDLPTAANPVHIASPLADAWVVGQGGHSELVNYHYVTSTQRDALDILQYRGSSTHQPGSTELASYYIYGKPVLAPADGTVTFVLDGRPDQQIGSTDRGYQAGKNVVIDIGNGHFLQMGHLSPGSIRVKVGDHVKLGQPIAKVGNSGNTTQPHLHIQAQTVGTGIGDVATMDAPAVLRTLHTIPLVFTDVVLTRRGVESQPVHADLRRGDLYVQWLMPAKRAPQ
jgi:hypothetical protein